MNVSNVGKQCKRKSCLPVLFGSKNGTKEPSPRMKKIIVYVLLLAIMVSLLPTSAIAATTEPVIKYTVGDGTEKLTLKLKSLGSIGSKPLYLAQVPSNANISFSDITPASGYKLANCTVYGTGKGLVSTSSRKGWNSTSDEAVQSILLRGAQFISGESLPSDSSYKKNVIDVITDKTVFSKIPSDNTLIPAFQPPDDQNASG